MLERGGSVAVGEGFALVVLDHLLDDAFRGGLVRVDDVDGDGAHACFSGGEGASLSGSHEDVPLCVSARQHGGEYPVFSDALHERGRQWCAGPDVGLDDEALRVDVLDGSGVDGGVSHDLFSLPINCFVRLSGKRIV